MIPLQNKYPQQYPTFDLEESEKVYQQLLEENMRLRSRVFPEQNAYPHNFGTEVSLPQRYAEFRQPERLPTSYFPYPGGNDNNFVPAFYSPEEMDARVKGVHTQRTQHPIV